MIDYQHYRDAFWKARLPGQQLPWLNEQRQQAMDYFLEIGFPQRKQEEWKYTSTQTIAETNFNIETNKANTIVFDPTPYLLEEKSYHAVFINGLLQHHVLPQTPAGLLVMSLTEAMQQQPDLVRRYLNQYADDQANGFAALNTALFNDGIFICLPKDCQLPQVIHLFFYTEGVQQLNTIRNLIIAGENSQVTIIEHYLGSDKNTSLSNVTTELIADENSKIQYYKVQQESQQSYHMGRVYLQQMANSSIDCYAISLGSQLERSDLHVQLVGDHAACSLYGLYAGQDKQHIDHHTRIEHTASHTHSEQYYKGILAEHAHGVFNGAITVAKGASKANAKQYNKNLLLSKTAGIDTKPQLEIFHDDVQCLHGATAGELDQQAIFYLTSRGLTEQAARQMLVHAFAADIIDKIKLDKLREQLRLSLSNHVALMKRSGIKEL